MACQRFADDVRNHAAGADPTPDLLAHLEACHDCRKDLARERNVLAAIDRDLADALRLEPSVGFNARVRERINENAGSGFSRIVRSATRVQFALGAASLVLIAAIAVTIALRTGSSRRHEPPNVASSANTQPISAPALQPQAPAPQTAAVAAPDHRPPGDRTSTRNRPVGSSRVAHTREPEVLVPPDQRMAIGRLLELIRAGKIDERAFAPAVEENGTGIAAQVVAPIVVEDLKVPPINIAVAGGTEKRN